MQLIVITPRLYQTNRPYTRCRVRPVKFKLIQEIISLSGESARGLKVPQIVADRHRSLK